MKYEANVETGEVIVREMTDEEIFQDEKDRANSAKIIEQQASVQGSKAALLEKLGITEEEAKLLLS